MENRYERQDNSYNMFQYTSKVLYIYCLFLHTTKKCSNLFIIFRTVVHSLMSYKN